MSERGVREHTWDQRPANLLQFHRMRLEHLAFRNEMQRVVHEIEMIQRQDSVWGYISGLERLRHHATDVLERYERTDTDSAVLHPGGDTE